MIASIKETTAGHEDACESLLLALQLFSRQSQYCLSPKVKDWYHDRMEQIERDLSAAPCPPSPARESAEPIDVTTDEVVRQLFQKVTQVPAGQFGAVRDHPFTVESVSINQVLIDNRPYRIYNLCRDERLVKIPDKDCMMIEVVGNSMNNPSGKTTVAIENGDFVLLAKQDAAQTGDIVAAEIDDDVDQLVTLKRYQVLPGKILLKPESSDPAFQHPFEFTAGDPRVHIRGVALAVFKPGTPSL